MPELCANPESHDKSLKAMESIGAVETVLKIWNDRNDAYVAQVVTDEDSTTRSKLSHLKCIRMSQSSQTDSVRS
jgi:hypothetical protein